MLAFWVALIGGFLLLRSTKVGAAKLSPPPGPGGGRAAEFELTWGPPDKGVKGEGTDSLEGLPDASEGILESEEAIDSQGDSKVSEAKPLVIDYNPFREGQKRRPSPYTVKDAPRTNGSLDDLADEEIDAELMGPEEEDQFADEEEDEDGGE